MSNRRSLLFESLKRRQTELPPSAQAELTIPMGTVGHVLQLFEERIANHQHERASVYTNRALDNTDELIRQGRTYAQQLRLAETLGLSHLPSHLRCFIRDHDNAYRAVIRSRHFANLTQAHPESFDVFARVGARILNASNIYALNTITTTHSPVERVRMASDPFFKIELQECTDLLVDEFLRVLKRLDSLRSILQSDEVELENVGPDHDIHEFGFQVPFPSLSSHDDASSAADKTIAPNLTNDPDPTNRCCICLNPYSPLHPAFNLTACTHTIGLPCLSTWLNSTAANATSCPYCRTLLCKRRARQPSSRSRDAYAEGMGLVHKFERARGLLADLDGLCAMVCGGREGRWFGEAVRAVNFRAVEMGLGVRFVWEDGSVVGRGWRLGMVVSGL
ncbi:hypothetical protein BKA63DRAFT_13810 [Paraphoma chrysanthemicola]|nr:hypothetical protein BKA63DRAFT_13810 [Paraphoma chrysanthemicola]